MSRAGTAPLVARVAWGGLLVARPAAGLRVLGGRTRPSAERVARVLGARHLVEAALEWRHGTRWRRAGAVVDGLHGASALAFAVADQRWRRAALTDAAIAATFAVIGFVDA